MGDEDSSQDPEDDDEFEITDLRSGREQVPAGFDGPNSVQPSALDTRTQRWTFRSMSIIVLLAVLTVNLPQTHDSLARLLSVPSPAAQSQGVMNWQSVVVVSQGATAPSTQAPDLPPPPLGTAAVPGPAPTNCWSGPPPMPTEIRSPTLGLAFGAPPLWVIGPSGPPPTLSLAYAAHPETAVDPFGWRLHDTEFGWPVPINLVVPPGTQGTVGLTGSDAASGQPVLFGLVPPGGSGLPLDVRAAIALDPQNPAIPAIGVDSTGTYWDGYVFLPGAGCYVLHGGALGAGWTLAVSAGL